MNANLRTNREGVIGVWMVVALLALMGMAALVFDVGRLTLAAQHLQNVADSAALAGALQLPEFDTCESRLAAMVQTSNETMPAWSATVAPEDDLVYYGPTQNVPGHGVLEDGEYAVTVTAHCTVTYTFARMFGINEVEVIRSATALSSGSGAEGDGILFAGETNPNVEGIRQSGSNLTVKGTMHSNTQVTITGNGHDIRGDVEYLNSYRINDPSGIRGDIVEDEVRPYPVDYTWAQFDVGPWDRVYSGNLTTSSLPSGRIRVNGNLTLQGAGFYASDSLWVVTGEIRFLGSGVALDRVTMVAQGTIRFNGTSDRFSSFQDDLFAMSLASGSRAIRVNGSNSDTWGILFAPNGEMQYNGGSQEIHSGALVARTIDISGSGGIFQGFGEGGNGSERSVRLIN